MSKVDFSNKQAASTRVVSFIHNSLAGILVLCSSYISIGLQVFCLCYRLEVDNCNPLNHPTSK